MLAWPDAGPSEEIAGRLCDDADASLARGDNVRAHETYQRATLVHPALPRAHLGLARALIGRRLFADALGALQRAQGLANQDARLWRGLAAGYRDSRSPDQAISAYRRSLEIGPLNTQAAVDLADVLTGDGHYPEAEAVLRTEESRGGPSAAVHRGMAYVFLRTGRTESSATRFTATLDLDPGDLEAACGLADALLRGGDPSRARVILADVVDRDPYHVRARFLLGRCLAATGDEGQARYHLAIFERQKKLTDRIGFLERAMAESPTAEGYQTLAHLYSTRGRDHLAADRLQRATALDPMVTAPQITAQPETH